MGGDAASSGRCYDCYGQGHCHDPAVNCMWDPEYQCWSDEEIPWPGPHQEEYEIVGTIKIVNEDGKESTTLALMDPKTSKVILADELGQEIDDFSDLPF